MMDEKPAKIYVSEGSQEYSAMFDGTVQLDGDTVHIRYDESPQERVHFSVIGDMITLHRVGELTYSLILENGKPFPFIIQSPFGKMSITVIPTIVRTHYTDNAVEIELEYEIGTGDDYRTVSLKLNCDLY